jgi:hypothetical protein
VKAYRIATPEYPPLRRLADFPPLDRVDPLRYDPELERLRELERRRILELELMERERALAHHHPADPRDSRPYDCPTSGHLDDQYGPRFGYLAPSPSPSPHNPPMKRMKIEYEKGNKLHPTTLSVPVIPTPS